MNDIDLVLPVLDEAEALPWVLARVPSGVRPIVVDNGSTDGSADIARSLGATVVVEQQRGFGAACAAGLAAFIPFSKNSSNAVASVAILPDLTPSLQQLDRA